MSPHAVRQFGTWENPGHDLEGYFDEHFRRPRPIGFVVTPNWRPATDVFETVEAYHVLMDLAAMHPEEIAIHFEGHTLTVSGVRQDGTRGQRHYHKMEIQFGPFERQLRFPRPVDADEIRSGYERGILEIYLPKAEERPGVARRVPIR
ncbi:MAG: Hsp20/alpha crystallin family protein [Gemmatimonadetes bacterium]|jgi:HSP20 family protein|nr:Hsp20/alpha crystallin family protein [Gemmatimonadota bacterium]